MEETNKITITINWPLWGTTNEEHLGQAGETKGSNTWAGFWIRSRRKGEKARMGSIPSEGSASTKALRRQGTAQHRLLPVFGSLMSSPSFTSESLMNEHFQILMTVMLIYVFMLKYSILSDLLRKGRFHIFVFSSINFDFITTANQWLLILPFTKNT